jgi:uncharacterized protein
MDPLQIIRKYYPPASLAYEILTIHSEMVADKALWLARRMEGPPPRLEFIYQAAMLHDIGIIRTHAPGIGCHGSSPYIRHGVLGSEMLSNESLPEHALVCERHTGVGISQADVHAQQLPLPTDRDFLPITPEEIVICFADKFFSKKKENLRREKNLTQVRKSIVKYGPEKLQMLESWIRLFGLT